MTTDGNGERISGRRLHPDATEAARLARARSGDPDEFSGLTEPYRRELQVHCYRMLGSLHDAEDVVQETLLRAWRRLDTYEGRASFRAWLYKIATNACLDVLDRRQTRRSLPSRLYAPADPHAPILPPQSEPSWLEPFPTDWLGEAAPNPEARYTAYESISLAFLIALQALPPRQRAALILADVLDWPAREVAELLGVSLSAVNSALHRARTRLANWSHGQVTEGLPRSGADERTQALLQRYVRAWEAADVAGLVALLKEDAALAMPPSPSWYRGRTSIAAFVATTVFADHGQFSDQAAGRWLLRATEANGLPAFGIYQRTAEDRYDGFGVHVLAFEAGQLAEIISFIDGSLLPFFGLPPTQCL